MTKIRANLAVSLDGFVAGPNQSAGEAVRRGRRRHTCTAGCSRTPTRTPTEIDARSPPPTRSSWGATCSAPAAATGIRAWTGWWGDEPAVPQAGLRAHPSPARGPAEVQGGTTFSFVTGGIHEAFKRAQEVPGEGPDRCDRRRPRHDQPVPRRRPHRRAAPARRAGSPSAPASACSTVRPLRLEQISGRSASLVTHITYRPRYDTRWRIHQKQPPSSAADGTEEPGPSRSPCSVQ